MQSSAAGIYRFGNAVPKIDGTVFVAPNATVIGDVEVGAGSSIWFGAILRGDVCTIRVGRRTNIQDGTIVHADGDGRVEIGDDVTIGHAAIVHGCTIEAGALIGMGAIVLDGAIVGAGALVGAGAVVSAGKMVEPGTLWLGCPAKKIRDLGPDDAASLRESAEHYFGEAVHYRSSHVARLGARALRLQRGAA